MHKTQDFDFEYPKELIATEAAARGMSRVLHIDRTSKSAKEITFDKIAELFSKGDVLVVNNSHVLWARLEAHKSTGAKLEVFFLREIDQSSWEVLIKGSVKLDNEIILPGELHAKVSEHRGRTVILSFQKPPVIVDYLTEHGSVPLPPYILQQRKLLNENLENLSDKRRYQTVWSKHPGSVAAPTASLHFEKHHLDLIRARGVEVVEVTLHVGAGTFLPVDTENLEDFKMHSEKYEVTKEAAAAINAAKTRGNKVWAVGTTALRVLESVAKENKSKSIVEAGAGETEIFIKPGYKFKVVDCLLTNFHQPQSTLLVLACAFVGDQRFLMDAYQYAISRKFRLFSYGDLTIIT